MARRGAPPETLRHPVGVLWRAAAHRGLAHRPLRAESLHPRLPSAGPAGLNSPPAHSHSPSGAKETPAQEPPGPCEPELVTSQRQSYSMTSPPRKYGYRIFADAAYPQAEFPQPVADRPAGERPRMSHLRVNMSHSAQVFLRFPIFLDITDRAYLHVLRIVIAKTAVSDGHRIFRKNGTVGVRRRLVATHRAAGVLAGAWSWGASVGSACFPWANG